MLYAEHYIYTRFTEGAPSEEQTGCKDESKIGKKVRIYSSYRFKTCKTWIEWILQEARRAHHTQYYDGYKENTALEQWRDGRSWIAAGRQKWSEFKAMKRATERTGTGRT